MAFLGVILCGISISCSKTARLGTDPFSCFVIGIWNIFKFKYNFVYTAINIAILLSVFFIRKKYIGVATLFTVFITGIVVEKGMVIMGNWFPDPSLFERGGLMLFAIVIMCFGSSLYFTANIGVSAYDAYALILVDKHIAPFKICRIATDIVCVCVGAFLGATIGIGTIATALCMGPLIDYFNNSFSKPFLEGKKLFEGGTKYGR
ncbi:hypothetical protein LL037_25295 (plasmid) [Clostridium estertheticum]|uniref:YczE/YyaS/YitT family protein n=1 Tax=Clostridium estertheticum TaxID=238834 RepID=UPI001C0D4FF5|nr:hypothetical protein [Clostridium estertheticum]MBU3201820.1 hypothetical protein [Clostridium estertheticum]WAG68143.1 hypothetical protein LL037_25295 [Clostridium estertheticum]